MITVPLSRDEGRFLMVPTLGATPGVKGASTDGRNPGVQGPAGS
jgi:hypothetical protein